MTEYEDFFYLEEKIHVHPFSTSPFNHLYIENFLSDEHFNLLVNDDQIAVPQQKSTEQLIDHFLKSGWSIQQFPGCTESIKHYLDCYNNNSWPVDKRIEGFGIALRLTDFHNKLIERLIKYLNSPRFHSALERKFSTSRPSKVETAIQKYLSGYEISPHPDIRSKCLTYLININPSKVSETMPIHTHLLKFKDDKKFIKEFWKYNLEIDRDWVPWDWCETIKETRENNSLVMFMPSNDTLHAVKLRYDHLSFQRTQIYGNLWYTDVPFILPMVTWEQFDLKPVDVGTILTHRGNEPK